MYSSGYLAGCGEGGKDCPVWSLAWTASYSPLYHHPQRVQLQPNDMTGLQGHFIEFICVSHPQSAAPPHYRIFLSNTNVLELKQFTLITQSALNGLVAESVKQVYLPWLVGEYSTVSPVNHPIHTQLKNRRSESSLSPRCDHLYRKHLDSEIPNISFSTKQSILFTHFIKLFTHIKTLYLTLILNKNKFIYIYYSIFNFVRHGSLLPILSMKLMAASSLEINSMKKMCSVFFCFTLIHSGNIYKSIVDQILVAFQRQTKKD